MFDDDQRVAEVAQTEQRLQQPGVVARVQADRGFVENVQHAGQPATDLRRQADTLRFAARKRVGAAVQRQVVQPNVLQKAEPRPDLAHNGRGDGTARFGEVQLGKKAAGVQNRHPRQLGDVTFRDRHRQDFGFVAGTVASGAGDERHKRLELFTRVVGSGFAEATLEVRHDALELDVKTHRLAVAAFVNDLDSVARTAQKRLLYRRRQVAPRPFEVETQVVGQGFDPVPIEDLVTVAAPPTPRRDSALRNRQLVVGNDQGRVELGT